MKTNNYVEKEIENNVILTEEEIKFHLKNEVTFSVEDLQQFLYNLSIVLYKSFQNEEQRLF
ncbi:hypothetical protein BH11BAC3_BH11BAC3_09560 [soil metagenome]